MENLTAMEDNEFNTIVSSISAQEVLHMNIDNSTTLPRLSDGYSLSNNLTGQHQKWLYPCILKNAITARADFARGSKQITVRLLATMLLFVALGALCADGAPKTLTLTEKDNGTIVKVNVGDHVVVRLPVTMGTGYSWQLANQLKEHLLLEGGPLQEHPPGAKPGETEVQVFRFVAKHEGKVPLAFRLVRPWEKHPQPLRTVAVKIYIR